VKAIEMLSMRPPVNRSTKRPKTRELPRVFDDQKRTTEIDWGRKFMEFRAFGGIQHYPIPVDLHHFTRIPVRYPGMGHKGDY